MIGEVQLCVLQVGGEDYLIDVHRVDEVVAVPKVTAVPRAPPFLEGVVRLRGEVLPVIDVRRRLGVPTPAERRAPARERRRERLVVCRVGPRHVGLLVDAVTQVLTVDRGELRGAPLAGGGRSPFVLGICRGPERMRLLLDVKALLEEGAAA